MADAFAKRSPKFPDLHVRASSDRQRQLPGNVFLPKPYTVEEYKGIFAKHPIDQPQTSPDFECRNTRP